MTLSFNTPINSVSFGQVSIALLREAHARNTETLVLPLNQDVDVSSQKQADTDFFKWIERGINNFATKHTKDTPTLKVWHLEKQQGFNKLSDNQAYLTFYELDSPTETEINIAKRHDKLLVTSKHTKEVLESNGASCYYVPLGFDKANFQVLDKEYHEDDRIIFNLCGKFEFRKRHEKILKAWVNKYGNDKRYGLQCALYNPFVNEEMNNSLIANALEGQKYFNVSFMPSMKSNDMYNDFLNSANIIIGMSGGEGWGLPEFQSVCLGKHAVILDAHGYKGWANSENSVMVSPTSKIDCVDGMFFRKGQEVNQGKIHDWNPDDFISGCEEAIKRTQESRTNSEGLKLQEKFSYKNTFDEISKILDL